MHAEHVALRSLIRAHFHQVLTARMATGLYIQGDLHVDGSWYSGVLGGQSATRGVLLAEGHLLTGSEEHRGVPQMPPALQRPPASRTTCTLHAPARQPHSCDHCASIPCVRSHARPRDRPCEAKGRSRRSVYIAWSCRASPVLGPAGLPQSVLAVPTSSSRSISPVRHLALRDAGYYGVL